MADDAAGGRRAPIEQRLREAGLPPLARHAWLEIDLDALAGNLAALRGAVGEGVRIEPVVKADAYGHGALPVTLALEAAGADGVSVAALDEALELRAGGVTLPIQVLYAAPPEWVADAAEARIGLSLGAGAASAAILEAAAARPSGAPALEVHLEVETGMGRGGVLPDDTAETVARIRQTPGVRLAGVWTHLAGADNRPYTLLQDERFGAVGPAVEAVERLHVAASGGVLAADARRWGAVRTGIAIYGLVPDGLPIPDATREAAAALRPVMSAWARPVRVVDLPAGHGVSYGPVFTTTRPSRIATLPLGYADGYRRFLTGAGSALVRGFRVPVVGRVSMDAIMVDVTDVPGARVTEADEFVLLGQQGDERITAYDLAAAGGTISYEIIAGMSRRLARVYHAAGSPVETRTLVDGRPTWQGSSSGTGISATWRWTRS